MEGSSRVRVQSLVAAAMGPALQGVQHLLHQIVDIHQFQPGGGVVHLDGQVPGHVVAEGGHGAVVVGTAPLAEEVGEPVDQHRGAGLFAVGEKQLLPCQLAFAVVRLAVPADEGGLYRAGQHHRAGIAVLFQRVQQSGGKAEVALHKFALVLGAVDPGQVEHKVGPGAVVLQQSGVGVQVVFKDLSDGKIRTGAVFALGDVAQIPNQIFAHKALGAGDENIHYFAASQFFRASCT